MLVRLHWCVAAAAVLLLLPSLFALTSLWGHAGELQRRLAACQASLAEREAALAAERQVRDAEGATCDARIGDWAGRTANLTAAVAGVAERLEAQTRAMTRVSAALEEAEKGPAAGAAGGLRVFRSNAPPTELYEQLSAAQNPADCNERPLYRCQLVECLGFGYQMHQVTRCLLEALYQNVTVVLWPNRLCGYGSQCNNNWTCFFEPLSTCEAAIAAGAFEHGDTIPLMPKTLPESWLPPGVSELGLENPGAFVVGTALKYALRPNERVRELLSNKVRPVDMAVHVRRTDKLIGEGWKHELEQYMQALDRVVHPRWNFHSAYGRSYQRSVYVATDEPEVWAELARYPQYKTRHGDGASLPRYSQAGLESLLVELFTMATADYFVGTFSSQLSRMVYELLHTRYLDAYNRAFSLDDPWYAVQYKMNFPDQKPVILK
eukprot:TRINITY_DN17125_c0_g1_i1.p1 TRINITY_DN17125_c0_g1~~TRINITY_DN17125_c0_g1_i1.p1  ORF type:complete len:446 (+),score=124.82 TRINITY_DN17125_c0_g1_i1:36-1340(+)